MSHSIYTDRFYSSLNQASLQSARVVVPLVMDLLRPGSVLDIGCGQGAWLRVFQDQGAKTVFGLDGDYVDRSGLLIRPEEFSAIDLTKPETINGYFDLAVCLEVAEHIPSKHARQLVQILTNAAPAVLFSAAIPGQCARGHVNTQRPEYWRKLFAEFGFRVFDPIRPRIRDDRRIAYWFRQNILLFASASVAEEYPALTDFTVDEGAELEWISTELATSLRFLLRVLPSAVKSTAKWKASRARNRLRKLSSGLRRHNLPQVSK